MIDRHCKPHVMIGRYVVDLKATETACDEK